MTSNHQTRKVSDNKIEQRAGDRAIQIGQVFGNVVFQLLSTKSVIVIIIALVTASVSLFYVYREAQKPARMKGDFNIAIAEFGEVTDHGIASSALARQISKLLFDFLDSEYKATDFGLNVQMAHDKIGVLTEDRQAERLAHDINADVVIYGSIFSVGNEATLSPRFYVKERPDTGELTGQHQLALPIQFDISRLGFQDEVNTNLRQRTIILVHFTTGLIYLSTDNLDAAARYFQEAIQESEKTERFDGQEVLYLVAAETFRLQGNFEKASDNLDQALSLNPGYARAYIARGNIYYNQAVKASFDETLLNKSLSEYQKAIEARDQPAGAYIMDKANISLGNIYVIRAQQTEAPELFTKAIYHYNQVITQYEKTGNERIREYTAVAYFGLGAAYERQKDYAQAEIAYRKCIDITSNSELKARAESQLNIVKKQD